MDDMLKNAPVFRQILEQKNTVKTITITIGRPPIERAVPAHIEQPDGSFIPNPEAQPRSDHGN